jgi:Zn-dependent M28 family amino/carboxypeptidase
MNMNPELQDRLKSIANWHVMHGATSGHERVKAFHEEAAADIRAAIVSADDATKNMLILRAHKAKDRRFSGESITGFDELQEQQS